MKIVLVQTSFLGDIALTTPLIGVIKEHYPDSSLSVVTTPLGADLLRYDERLSEIISFDKNGSERSLIDLFKLAQRLRAAKYDMAFGVQRSFRTSLLLALARIPLRVGFAEARGKFLYHRTVQRDKGRHDVLRNISICSQSSYSSEDAPIRLFSAPDTTISPDVVAAMKEGSVVVVPGSVWATKRWDWRNFRELCLELVRRGERVVVMGSPQEREICEKVSFESGVINLAGKTSIQDFIWSVEKSSAVVCNDSFALHVSSAFKKPTVAIFCATSPKFGFGPWNKYGVVVEKEGLSCKPCARHGGVRCPTGTWSCMKDLDVGKVIQALEGVRKGGL